MDPHDTHDLPNQDERPLPPLPTSEIESSECTNHQTQKYIPKWHPSQTTSQDVTPRRVSEENTDSSTCHYEVASHSSSNVSLHLQNQSQSSVGFLDELNSVPESSAKSSTSIAVNHNSSNYNAHSQSDGSRAFISMTNPLSIHDYSLAAQDSTAPLRSLSTRNSENSLRNSSISHRTSSLPRGSNQAYISETRELVMPKWQIDSEVIFCPICKSRFSFFLRKHHCRMCGRVVCNSCSPHRITIPYRYIVQPPFQGEASTSSTSGIQRSCFNRPSEDLEGGQQVRLCNPCVPDSTTAPPRIVGSLNDHHRNNPQSLSTHSTFAPPSESSSRAAPYLAREAFIATNSNPPHHRQPGGTRSRAQTTIANDPSHTLSHYQRGDRAFRPSVVRNRSRSSPISSLGQLDHDNSSFAPINSTPYQNRRSFSITNQLQRPLPKPPPKSRRQISEEDECWICHEELPSRRLENCEALRAAHVNTCIHLAIQLASGTQRAASSMSRTLPEENNPQPEAENLNSSTEDHLDWNQQNNNQLRSLNLSRGKRTGVFPYSATEKDCVDNAECAICLEEFEVSAEMGRLECFCRFHLKCIRDWFETRPGQCPVHQHCSGY